MQTIKKIENKNINQSRVFSARQFKSQSKLQVQKTFQPQDLRLLVFISHKCSVVKYKYEGNCRTLNVELYLETRENQSHITGKLQTKIKKVKVNKINRRISRTS